MKMRLFREAVSEICTVSSIDYFTSTSMHIGFYISFHILWYQNVAQWPYEGVKKETAQATKNIPTGILEVEIW